MKTFEMLAFYRGVSARYRTDQPSIIIPRRDRRPRNSGQDFHEVADRWFAEKFGIAFRSQGVFLTSCLTAAKYYGASPEHVMRIVPLSGYEFCWSPNVKDLLFAANKMKGSPGDAIRQFLDSAGYRRDGLKEAHEAGNEVMLFCERYVAIPVELIETGRGGDETSIILP